MISRLRLVHYKGFNDFTLSLKGSSVIVGPNNAGKTTIIGAVRLCAYLINQAHSRKPDVLVFDETRDRKIPGFTLALPESQFTQENIRHEFRETETRLELEFTNRAKLFAVWPVEDDAYFYLEQLEGMPVRDKNAARQHFGSIGVVPTISPVEHREVVLTYKHVKENYNTRLVSRHFRNQIYHLRDREPDKYPDFVAFALENTPEIERCALNLSTTSGEPELDFFYRETSTHTEKEIYWAGDGLQIWLQVLFHIWRQPDASVLVLDEPDVFLHPDLQRRLVRVLEDVNSQVILATHAPEVLAEWSRESVVIVDRTKGKSRRVNDDRAFAKLNDALGSGFNLRLAKTLRSRVALFVEGTDMKILRNVAKTVGAHRFSKEKGLAVVPMEGYSKRGMSSAFGWLNESFLNNAVDVFVVLDRDYRSDQAVEQANAELKAFDVRVHAWKRKELESYFLEASTIARMTGLDLDTIESLLDECVQETKTDVLSRYLSERYHEEKGPKQHLVSTNQKYLPEFDTLWANQQWRRHAAPPKAVISALNEKLQEIGKKPVSARGISYAMRRDEVPAEMRDLILNVEQLLHTSHL
ncbi:putative AbiEii toxin of type IV toxin-antitoxin system [Saccharothrix saharensis]|uniref:Putative AbiEii toxin of type IV toxin-antitoxin system n=1 Tax=Saccharothrix saharensis TaxID=571190 RepID=A0A543JLP6_9PSEU|nr:ATP-binding protein [Saccharothrix saharensis]TQM83725.1 putative AbiEii toxin of type IV toxin-antitoxin system [Saccharothrix saharensis]